jgi:hypothetical protein
MEKDLRYLAGRLAGETDMQVSPRVAFMNLAQNFSTALVDPHPEFHMGYIDAVTELFFEQRQAHIMNAPATKPH